MFSARGRVFFVLCCIGFILPCWSQIISGSIRGVVINSDGQPIPGATVEIQSDALIGQNRSDTTNQSGVFRFPSLPIGIYSVEARLDGFESIRANKVEVNLGETSHVPLMMRLSRLETVHVTGEIPMIDLHNAGVPTIFKQEMVGNLSTRRNMWTLIQVAPGVTTDAGDDLNSGVIAFGSNRQSNSWHVDGLDVTGPETGHRWVETNPDIIQQIQVYGTGAPAEYGNHLGAALNVVLKQGSNDLHGAINSYFQTEALSAVNVRLPDSEFVYNRDKYYNVSGQLGGPIAKDKLWFFGAIFTTRDAYSPPGIEPQYAPLFKYDLYDLKLTTRFRNHELNGYLHAGTANNPGTQTPSIAESAVPYGDGSETAGGMRINSPIRKNMMLELGYAGFGSTLLTGSQTGSLEEPYITIAGMQTGGVMYPYDWYTGRHQVDGKMTYFADDFLKSQHEFKFGVQYAYRLGDTITSLGPNGSYTYDYYGYIYQYYQQPFHYGAVSHDLGFFLDDTLIVNDRLTLNLGLRFDHNTGSIQDFETLEVGTPSIVTIGNFRPTGEIIPGVENVIRWNLFSPRVGFVWQPRADGKSVFRGSFGVYYDHNVTGNWDSPPPGIEPTEVRSCNSGECEFIHSVYAFGSDARQEKLKAPRALQYSLGYELQPTQNSSIGIQYVHKDTKNLVGWQIVGGEWTSFLFTDPFTGRQYTLLHPVASSPAVIQKGNDPGDFPGSEGLRYFQKYHGVILSLSKRFADSWALNASYTWSRSRGMFPRPVGGLQGPALFYDQSGTDPNHFVNAEAYLQGDRPHMLRAQVVFFNLPWDLQVATSAEFSSGRPYTRQIRVSEPGFPATRVTMDSSGSLRHEPIRNIDLTIGRKFAIANRVQLSIDAEILNLLNSDQELHFITPVLQNPDQTFVPDQWVLPRRLQIQLGLQF